MKRQSKRIIAILGATALIASAAGAVFAYGGYGPGYGPGWGGHHGHMGGPGHFGGFGGPGAMMGGYGYTDQQLATLKQTLGITPAQENAWNNYTQTLRERDALMQAHHQAMFTNGFPGTDQRLAFHQQGLALMQRIGDAQRALFATLTPQQQTRLGGASGAGCWTR
jgi:Spy/CpxP family protein refolding chaperone